MPSIRDTAGRWLLDDDAPARLVELYLQRHVVALPEGLTRQMISAAANTTAHYPLWRDSDPPHEAARRRFLNRVVRVKPVRVLEAVP